jgi:hypothetical protein
VTTPSFGQPGYDPATLAKAAQALRSAPAPGIAPPDEGSVAAGLAARQAAAPAGVTTVDVDALFAGMQAMQQQIDALLAEKASGAGIPVQATAESLRELIKTHASQSPGTDHTDLLRLADDAVDAAVNAASSGIGGPVVAIAGKVVKALQKVNPGPGDFHYFRQALGFAEVHLVDAAEALVPRPARQPAGQVTSSQPPATVIQGSVTG